jgi:N-acetylglucosaminyl-diphospho-decaprenol L-rhamnosyltransferase
MRPGDPGSESGGHDLRVAVVAVNYGSHELLRRYLSWAFVVPGYDGPDIVIVDNRRSDDDRVAITQLAREAGWHLVAPDTNLGFGAGVNLGAQAAWERGADVMVIVNPDLEIARADIEALVSAIAGDPQALVAPVIVDRTGRPWGRLGRVDIRRTCITLTDKGEGPLWVSGACLAIHRRLWDTIGGMDGDYFLYWEDVDLSVRVQEAGGAVRLLRDVVVVHDVGGTQQGAGKSSTYYYFNVRNRLIFASKRLKRREMLWWLVRTPSDIRAVASRGAGVFPGRAAKWRAALPPALRGCVAGAWWIATHPGRAAKKGT